MDKFEVEAVDDKFQFTSMDQTNLSHSVELFHAW